MKRITLEEVVGGQFTPTRVFTIYENGRIVDTTGVGSLHVLPAEVTLTVDKFIERF